MNEGTPSRLRASDDDRERVTAALSDAFAGGQLDYEEYDERARRVREIRHREDLLAVLTDLMPDPAAALRAPPPSIPRDTEPGLPEPTTGTVSELGIPQVTGEPGGQVVSFAVMGLSEKRGDWLLGRGHTCLSLMGGTVLDLRRARFTARETTIWAFGVMGSVEILVPEDIRVLGDGVGVLGSFEVRRDDDVSATPDDLPPGAPLLRVRGLGLVGAVVVRRVRRESAG